MQLPGGTENHVTVPVGVIRPMSWGVLALRAPATNQMFPSGPAVISDGTRSSGNTTQPALGTVIGNSVIVPDGVIRPTALFSENQRLPSGPVVIPLVGVLLLGSGKYVTEPEGVIRPIAPVVVNQRLPSGPAVIATDGAWNWVNVAPAVPLAAAENNSTSDVIATMCRGNRVFRTTLDHVLNITSSRRDRPDPGRPLRLASEFAQQQGPDR